VTVRGDLLSCYTTSIAGWLAQQGVEYEQVLAPQWFLAAENLGEDLRGVEFCHYHTSLLGGTRDYRFEVEQRRSFDGGEAFEAIAAEVERSGSAIVMADTLRAPWLVTHGKSSAPHWVIVDEVRRSDMALHVNDRFEWIDDRGEQQSTQGWVSVTEAGALAYSSGLERDSRFRARERWAFGEPLSVPEPPDSEFSWRWLVMAKERPLVGTGSSRSDAFVRRSCTDFAERSVRTLRALTDAVAGALSDPETYGTSNDFWVIGRTRTLFVEHALAEPRGLLARSAVRVAVEWARNEIVSRWDGLARLLRYNATVLGMGRAPREGAVRVLHELADLEELFLERLASATE
jgi:hypothetical protein